MATPKITPVSGYAQIYIFECLGRFKVGWTVDALKRLKSQQAGNPFRLRLAEAHRVQREFARQVEAAIHRDLAPFRVDREWFRASFAEVQAVVRAQLEAVRAPVLPTPKGLTQQEIDDLMVYELTQADDEFGNSDFCNGLSRRAYGGKGARGRLTYYNDVG